MKRRALLKGIAAAPLAALLPAALAVAGLDNGVGSGWKVIARPVDPQYSQWFTHRFLALRVGDEQRALSECHRYTAIHPIHDDIDITDNIRQWLDYLPKLEDAPEFYQFQHMGGLTAPPSCAI